MVVFETISLKIHHGGYFTGVPNMEWKGGVVDVLDGMDVDLMSYWELVGIIGDLGLPSSSLMYYQVPGLDFRSGLRLITDDNGVMSMLEYYKSTDMVPFYVERVNPLQVIGSDENVIVGDRLLIENNNGDQEEMEVGDGDVTQADDTGGGSGNFVQVGDDVEDGLRDVHLVDDDMGETTDGQDPFDADQAYLQRKFILQNHLIRSSANSQQESELARKIVYRWDEATIEVRQAYRQFIAAVAELIDREVVSEDFREMVLAVYRLFSERLEEDDHEDWRRIAETKLELQNLLGHAVLEAHIQKVSSLAQSLARLQPDDHGQKSQVSGSDDDLEFGADLVFHPPARFLVDVSLEDDELLGEESTAPPPLLDDGWFDHGNSTNTNPAVDDGHFNLIWLRDACDKIVKESGSQLSGDELAMAICRVLDLDKPGDEIAGDLLDLIGDSAFETVQDLITHRKVLVDAVHHGLLVMKSDKKGTGTESRMPSYGIQVTVQTESERQIDKIRRKEEKKHRRGTDHGVENDLSALSFSSLLHASEKKSPFDDLIGRGEANTLAVTSLPQGTVRKHHKGYEEVIIPPIPTAPMKPGEILIEIKELDDFAQAAFHGYKSLNRIQSRIFQTTYNSNENILVCAPTGAGKTNIAMIAVLHEVLGGAVSYNVNDLVINRFKNFSWDPKLMAFPFFKGESSSSNLSDALLKIGLHFKDGYLHKDEFKIVYVAPMKALAAEVTKTFSHRLAPLNVIVKELTGDMQLSRNELEETQMIVTTPEKWDVITRKSSDMALSMLVKLLIIDEVHLLNDDRGPVIEALVARTLRQGTDTWLLAR
ncbi:hypothetical protein RJ640_003259 [Escallonia rubra]|uniref:Helicase ATP-binding domain-containing protein n=1 Tax=Escallonia rubra TaxID=112253 RepID=A0AA88R2C7_9ASTE|nr:hypothetical protein RJ640_003259 [Escallonia rubra]